MSYLLIMKRCELYGFSAIQNKYIIIIIVRLLMRHGADATSKNSSKHPPRDLVANGNQEVRREMYFFNNDS